MYLLIGTNAGKPFIERSRSYHSTEDQMPRVRKTRSEQGRSTCLLRDATASDAAAVATLLAELGYRRPQGDVAKALSDLQGVQDRVIVAEQQGEIIGLVTIHRTSFLHRVADGRVTSVVVAGSARGLGVGRELVEAAEAVVREWGCARIEVT